MRTPDALKRIESGLLQLGMQRQADELVTAMNRAAEQAVPEAKALLVGAVKNMSVQDAKGILTGGETAATDYFRRTTSDQLTQKFLPLVTRATSKVGLAEKYNNLAGQGAHLGLVDAKQTKIENYVTQKALDGLFLMVLRPFKAGDMITAGGVTGDVREIGLLVTAVDTVDNIRVYVGNNKLFSDSIQNHSVIDVCSEANYAVPETRHAIRQAGA